VLKPSRSMRRCCRQLLVLSLLTSSASLALASMHGPPGGYRGLDASAVPSGSWAPPDGVCGEGVSR
jgi:hypothetical protein